MIKKWEYYIITFQLNPEIAEYYTAIKYQITESENEDINNE